jgi:uncharacterized protein (TIGR02145 family)
MKTKMSFLLAVAFATLALMFFACSSDGSDYDGDADAEARARAAAEAAAAAAAAAAAEAARAAETVVIGNQTWLKHNLNVMHKEGNGDSRCYGEGAEAYEVSYDDYESDRYITLTAAQIQANCAKYGRLYDYAAAMDLPSRCNSEPCADLIQPKHRGLCPQGFHIPTDEDWMLLVKYVDPNWTSNDEEGGNIAGIKLKATSDWDTELRRYDDDPVRPGTDDYGFAALPGGAGFFDVDDHDGLSFGLVGALGSWWSSASTLFFMIYNYEEVLSLPIFDKTDLLSVRCVKD